MRIRKIFLLPLLVLAFVGGARANWQYDGTYIGDGWYTDDGMRFVLSFRGGASMGMASMKNEVGALSTEYYYNETDGSIISAAYYDACVDAGGCDGFVYAGVGELGALPATEDFSSFAAAAGVSVGWTIPNSPQWRVELGYDHISESSYSAAPLYAGDLTLTSGVVASLESGAVQSNVSTDIISAMAFYDFFDSLNKPLRQMIPYVGFGVGYADSKTVMNLSDLYGDLSYSVDLGNFGEYDDYGVLQFYRSTTHTSNIAGLLSAGFSYGINEQMFLDFGVRLMYIPNIKWALSNDAAQDIESSSDYDARSRDWISADGMIYTNFMLGLRFEF